MKKSKYIFAFFIIFLSLILFTNFINALEYFSGEWEPTDLWERGIIQVGGSAKLVIEDPYHIVPENFTLYIINSSNNKVIWEGMVIGKSHWTDPFSNQMDNLTFFSIPICGEFTTNCTMVSPIPGADNVTCQAPHSNFSNPLIVKCINGTGEPGILEANWDKDHIFWNGNYNNPEGENVSI
ncbi:MAG: hypothetical protein QXL50_02560, partial [Candidatus Pacearchaeota archaeon]